MDVSGWCLAIMDVVVGGQGLVVVNINRLYLLFMLQILSSSNMSPQELATNIEMFSFQLKPFLVPLLPLTDSVDVFTKHWERSHPSSVFLILYFQSLKTQTFSWLNVVPTVRAKYRMTKIIKVKSIDISLCLNNHKINNFLLQNTNKPTVSPFLKGVIARDIFFCKFCHFISLNN